MEHRLKMQILPTVERLWKRISNYLQDGICSIFMPPIKHLLPHFDCFFNVKIPSFQKPIYKNEKEEVSMFNSLKNTEKQEGPIELTSTMYDIHQA